jgi:hypothetical protein
VLFYIYFHFGINKYDVQGRIQGGGGP